MQAVILAGGYGTRISEETYNKPKPMVLIGGKPIIWHIMKLFSFYGVNDFVVCCGYQGYVLKQYFASYYERNSDLVVDLASNNVRYISNSIEPWKVTLVDTGAETMTGGRIKRVESYITSNSFFMTYGDGLADINLADLMRFHLMNKTLVTVTAVRPLSRYGTLSVDSRNHASAFAEKDGTSESWVNGGFFVLNKKAIDYIRDDQTVWEEYSMQRLTADHELSCFKHTGFWQSMDTLRDQKLLQDMWSSGNPPWMRWK